MEKTNKKMYINDIIALCHIIDEFDMFNKKIMSISKEYDGNFPFELLEAWRVECLLGDIKLSRLIDTINRYSNVKKFIVRNYPMSMELCGDIEFFYGYLLRHKEEIPKILELLQKLKELGFDKFEFNQDLDLTKNFYHTDPSLRMVFGLNYVASPQIIPSRDKLISYKTTDSNYEMFIAFSGISEKIVSKSERKIVLKSLLFNPNTLPEKLDIDHTYGKLVKLKEQQKYTLLPIVRSAIELNTNILALEQQFNNTNETICRLNDIKTKKELVEVLNSIKENIGKLKSLKIEHFNSISKENSIISPEILESYTISEKLRNY